LPSPIQGFLTTTFASVAKNDASTRPTLLRIEQKAGHGAGSPSPSGSKNSPMRIRFCSGSCYRGAFCWLPLQPAC
jgi:hypothetical protein